MSKRHSDAIAIAQGAVNISGMAHSLVSACRECLDSHTPMRDDAAVRLIVSQIEFDSVCRRLFHGEIRRRDQ